MRMLYFAQRRQFSCNAVHLCDMDSMWNIIDFFKIFGGLFCSSRLDAPWRSLQFCKVTGT